MFLRLFQPLAGFQGCLRVPPLEPQTAPNSPKPNRLQMNLSRATFHIVGIYAGKNNTYFWMLRPPHKSSRSLQETFLAFSHARQPSNSSKSTFLEPSGAQKSSFRENVENQVWRHQNAQKDEENPNSTLDRPGGQTLEISFLMILSSKTTNNHNKNQDPRRSP